MVLDLDGQPLCTWVEGRATWNSPRRQDAADLEAEVIVESAGPVAMYDEPTASLRFATGPRRRWALADAIVGLGRPPEIAL
jgi:hypothetical protein